MRGKAGVKAQIKQVLRNVTHSMVRLSARTRTGRYLLDQVLNAAMERVREVNHGGLALKFAAPNSLCDWRAQTFSVKEPETLEWIDALQADSILWDVGANVGLYAVYAARKRNCRIWAFEPSVFNLELLARNISANGLAEQICIVPMALSDMLGANQLRMTTTEWGGALSTFGRNFGWDGESIRQVFEFRTMGLSMDDAVQKLSIPEPDYIKMDVDGLEHIILGGGAAVLRGVQEVLIEVNDDFHEQAERCRTLLSEAGLVLKEKRHSDIVGGSDSGFQNCYNQIWIRN